MVAHTPFAGLTIGHCQWPYSCKNKIRFKNAQFQKQINYISIASSFFLLQNTNPPGQFFQIYKNCKINSESDIYHDFQSNFSVYAFNVFYCTMEYLCACQVRKLDISPLLFKFRSMTHSIFHAPAHSRSS